MLSTTTTPLNQTVAAIQFSNIAPKPGILTGQLTILNAQDRKDLYSYELHWGRSDTEKLSSESAIKKFTPGKAAHPDSGFVFEQPLIHEFSNTPIPTGATHLLVFALDSFNGEKLYSRRALLNQQSLLPNSATRLEHSLANTCVRLSQLPVLHRSLWDPLRCPDNLLPWLAWGLSVDTWIANDNGLDSLRLRELLRGNAFVHQHKGTVTAVRRALQHLAEVKITMTEWWEQEPKGAPYTFHLDLLINSNMLEDNSTLSSSEYKRITDAIDAVIPARCHYTFTISLVQDSTLRMAATTKAVNYKNLTMTANL